MKWYDTTKWLLERIDNFPKSQRFIFGQRLADHAIAVLELLGEAAYGSDRRELLSRFAFVPRGRSSSLAIPIEPLLRNQDASTVADS